MSEEKKLTDEKTLEFDDDFVDLFVEFDEGINVPNKTELSDEEIVKALEMDCLHDIYISDCETCHLFDEPCPLFDEDCNTILPKALKELIHRLQVENVTLKTELCKECEEHKQFVELAKKVDTEQKAEIERLHKVLVEEFVSLKAVKIAQNSPQAMKMLVESVGCVQKDTAKEILDELLDLEVKDEDYKMFFLDVCEKLEKFAQKYGVEVE